MNVGLVSAVLMLIASCSFARIIKWPMIPFDAVNHDRLKYNIPETRRIYFGSPAPDGKFPFLVYLYLQGNRCAGSLIRPTWVLTAAHCMDEDPDFDKMAAIGGKANLTYYFKNRYNFLSPEGILDEDKLQVREVFFKNYYLHPQYDEKTLHYDIALLLLERPMEGLNITLAVVAQNRMPETMSCSIQGWGLKEGDNFQPVLYYLEDLISGSAPGHCKDQFKENFVCMSSKRGGACLGDSGSPLLCEGIVYGVLSHIEIPGENVKYSCGISARDYFTEVYPYLEWMEETIKSRAGQIEVCPTMAWAGVGGYWFASSLLRIFSSKLINLQ